MSTRLVRKRERIIFFVLQSGAVVFCIILSLVGHTIFTDAMIKYPSKKTQIEGEITDLKNTISSQKQQIKEYVEIIDILNEENISLQNTIKVFAFEGEKPENYIRPASNISRGAVSRYGRMKYSGEWLGTAYTPSSEECGNRKGITSSGKPIVPGYTIAVDTQYWQYGQKFYIEGIGIVEAMDTGSAIKGRERFDVALFDREAAFRFGKRNLKVWLIEENP